MIISNSSCILARPIGRVSRAPSKVGGFTLVEIMISVSLFSMIITSVLSTFLVYGKGIASLGNYSIMSSSSRDALEYFSRDARVASSLTTVSADEVVFVLPSDAGGDTIRYKYDSATRDFKREKYSSGGTLVSTDIFFEDVEEFQLHYYNRLDEELDIEGDASILIETKTIQVNAKLLKKVINQNNTDYIISARFLMRNR